MDRRRIPAKSESSEVIMSNEDISFYVVALNQCMANLNKLTRQMTNPDRDAIAEVARTIKINAEMLTEKVKQ